MNHIHPAAAAEAIAPALVKAQVPHGLAPAKTVGLAEKCPTELAVLVAPLIAPQLAGIVARRAPSRAVSL